MFKCPDIYNSVVQSYSQSLSQHEATTLKCCNMLNSDAGPSVGDFFLDEFPQWIFL